ncbi:kinase-like domain-containing protein [Rhizophagus irregularis DAOM 181602=DAOM 197198]|nr:kinase-like domain-containing protein [Rhizophagus irregularis DAOM 181602=DAOM 197198]
MDETCDSDDSDDSDDDGGEDGEDNENNEDSKSDENSQYSEICSQIKVCNEIGRKKFKSRSSKDKPKNIQTHSQAIYTISECLDVQLSELELNEICQDGENNIES